MYKKKRTTGKKSPVEKKYNWTFRDINSCQQHQKKIDNEIKQKQRFNQAFCVRHQKERKRKLSEVSYDL